MATRGELHVSWGQVNTDEFQLLLEENEGSWLMEKQTNGKRPAQKSYCSWIAKDFPQEGTRDSGFFGLSFHVEPNHVQADASGAVFNKAARDSEAAKRRTHCTCSSTCFSTWPFI